jgi:hypothetical protein
MDTATEEDGSREASAQSAEIPVTGKSARHRPWSEQEHARYGRKTRVRAILCKIQSGTDLTGDQKADVFALSMSKVFFVDWQWKYHLNIDPEIKLPTRMTRSPNTRLPRSRKLGSTISST